MQQWREVPLAEAASAVGAEASGPALADEGEPFVGEATLWVGSLLNAWLSPWNWAAAIQDLHLVTTSHPRMKRKL